MLVNVGLNYGSWSIGAGHVPYGTVVGRTASPEVSSDEPQLQQAGILPTYLLLGLFAALSNVGCGLVQGNMFDRFRDGADADINNVDADADGVVDASGDADSAMDGEVDVDVTCALGDLRESYSGPAGTENVGACRPQVEECQDHGDGPGYYVIEEEILPSEEVCDGVDNDCLGETPAEEWNWIFSIHYRDEANSVRQTNDGGFILAGCSGCRDGSSDVWLIKTDEMGNELWNKEFGGDTRDEAYSIQQTSDGGFILAGYTASYGAGEWDAWLIKTDASGNEEWNRTFGGPEYNIAESVQQTSDGGFILAGTELVKTDSMGNQEWSRAVHGNSVWQTSDGGFVLVEDDELIKTDSSGIEEWRISFGGDEAQSVQQTSDGGFIFAGCTESDGSGGRDAWLVKTDASGNELWNRTFGGTSNDEAYSVRQTSDGGYILAGETSSYGAGGVDGWLIRTDAEGFELWNMTFGGVGVEGDFVKSVQQTSDGGFVLAGYTDSYEAEWVDAWLIRVCIE